MASLSQIVSEMAHSVGHPNNKALRENIKLLIIQTRNEVIRRSYEKHGYIDKGLTQRFRVKLITVADGDIVLPENMTDVSIDKIKRTENIVPRPVRLTNNLPFDRISTVGYKTNLEIPYVKETSARFTSKLPGMCGMPRYDYINGYIYIFSAESKIFSRNQIIIESVFEHPNPIDVDNNITTDWDAMMDENEYLISEDMLGQIKDIIYKRDLLVNFRETNEHSINKEVI